MTSIVGFWAVCCQRSVMGKMICVSNGPWLNSDSMSVIKQRSLLAHCRSVHAHRSHTLWLITTHRAERALSAFIPLTSPAQHTPANCMWWLEKKLILVVKRCVFYSDELRWMKTQAVLVRTITHWSFILQCNTSASCHHLKMIHQCM